MAEQFGRQTAWRDIDVMLLALGTVVGVGSWIAASVGVGYAKSANGEMAWANLGVVGLIIFGSAIALWLLRGRRAIGARRVSLIRLEPAPGEAPAAMTGQSSWAGTTHAASKSVRVAGGSLVHLSTCPLVEGKTIERLDDASRPGAPHCQVCAP